MSQTEGDGAALSQAGTARPEITSSEVASLETAAHIIVSQQKGGVVINFGTGFTNRKQCGGGAASFYVGRVAS